MTDLQSTHAVQRPKSTMKKSPLSRLIFPLDQLLELPNVSKEDSNFNKPNQEIQKFTKIFEEAPEEIFQGKYLNNPKLNVKMIAQSRLSGKSWKSLATKFQVSESRLRIFWYRSVKELTPQLKAYLSETEKKSLSRHHFSSKVNLHEETF